MQKEIDPVCGKEILPERAEGSSYHEGRQFYFCSWGCHKEFETDPEKFASKQRSVGQRGI
jgi:P-type Cu+ transporter